MQQIQKLTKRQLEWSHHYEVHLEYYMNYLSDEERQQLKQIKQSIQNITDEIDEKVADILINNVNVIIMFLTNEPTFVLEMGIYLPISRKNV